MPLAAFPALPQPPLEQGPWSVNVSHAHARIANTCAHVDVLLETDDSEPLQFKMSMEKLMNNSLSLLEAMETTEYNILPREWIEEAAVGLDQHVIQLRSAQIAASKQEIQNVLQVAPITIIQNGK
ncbi:hypothetical protein K439DRAFT_84460 [Ramaria rubella]|nr:hypothetical protein K439DRAFT_84460 [Ramaria rubella]